MNDNYILEDAIQKYLNTIVYFSSRKIPINEASLNYLKSRATNAFHMELGNKELTLQPDDMRNIIVTLLEENQ